MQNKKVHLALRSAFQCYENHLNKVCNKQQKKLLEIMASKDNNMYEGEYIWKIKGSKLSEMKKAKNKDEFVSDIFEMGCMNWCIEVCPNGESDDNIGSFDVYVKLLSSPPQNGTKIIIFKRIY
eukprot:245030_1